jgi:hypothetical protein
VTTMTRMYSSSFGNSSGRGRSFRRVTRRVKCDARSMKEDETTDNIQDDEKAAILLFLSLCQSRSIELQLQM